MRSDGLCLSKKQENVWLQSIKHTFHKAEYADKIQFYKIKKLLKKI